MGSRCSGSAKGAEAYKSVGINTAANANRVEQVITRRNLTLVGTFLVSTLLLSDHCG